MPPVLDSAAAITDAARLLAAGTGPLAVDAERASGFRYSNRAYLIQLRRAGAGSFLIDPIPVDGDLTPLADAINDLEWVLHSADQDLPGLAELGLYPARLYDTELGGRLAGYERVGLAAMVEKLLGRELRKGHGAADWSTRPLPDEWLNYAALDVELLLELRDAVAQELEEQGKTDWAAQEFEHVRLAEPSAPKSDRWRRTSGIHTLRRTRQLGVVRELWTTRDRLARLRDVAPARILPDSAIVAAANSEPKSIAQLRALPVFGGPRQRRYSREWLGAVERARALPERAAAAHATVRRPAAGQPVGTPGSGRRRAIAARSRGHERALQRSFGSCREPADAGPAAAHVLGRPAAHGHGRRRPGPDRRLPVRGRSKTVAAGTSRLATGRCTLPGRRQRSLSHTTPPTPACFRPRSIEVG